MSPTSQQVSDVAGNITTKTKFFVLLCLILFPFVAHAKVGTLLMWATMLHLVIGNALIGFGEGLLLAKLFHLHKKNTAIP